jgi:hypothetical protein
MAKESYATQNISAVLVEVASLMGDAQPSVAGPQ